MPSPQPQPQPRPSQIQIQKSLHRISTHPTLSPYRRRVYRVLLSIPPGRWTTYSALAKYLNSSARAIGTAMRTNPFAPDVPCHRVLAADRTLGGYMGSSNAKGGKNLERKKRMLEGEGVKFIEDDNGARGVKAVGGCFVDFTG
ncbi:hypothetical protein EYZ11_006842 [Aspergillus tanneri]|uniref:Methylated-DNA--protein-cysteine methyltransferase n=1 Tax=Aspergillus tanneri TaxID=1220188 RepID=A0A4S3JEE9_9EURO|nr:uncharacterized protein ATNIH1004_005893 [Aspergillus tanneri]KAA8647203.1 hypothetical protein ATNIH1004_005893 [Aspergillus tanneri]THC93666.1 hypothetical protein EYZ11_006842 [Aspergillus tanneri]